MNMQQRRWIELFSDYECKIRYHPGKANVVADALSRKEQLKPRRVRAMAMTVQIGMRERIQVAQRCMRIVVMDEAHKSKYSVHPGDDKIEGTYSCEKLAKIYVDEIVARHGVPVSIILDRDGRFTSRCWQTVQKALGTMLDMSTGYHPQTDGQSERTIQTLEDMLRAYAEIGESSLIGPELVQETTDKVVLIKEKLKAERDRQKSYADNRRKPLEFEVGDRVMFESITWKGVIRFGKKGKLGTIKIR
ncbi:putative reverse transcriptase domain-containing protein [Tanacetum coccineum]